MNCYENPKMMDLVIDRIVASDGNTFRRWTIIDNNLTRDPCNSKQVFTIVIDNLAIREISGPIKEVLTRSQWVLRQNIVIDKGRMNGWCGLGVVICPSMGEKFCNSKISARSLEGSKGTICATIIGVIRWSMSILVLLVLLENLNVIATAHTYVKNFI